MTRSKKFYKNLEALDGIRGSVFKQNGELVQHGIFHYENNQLHIEELRIPLRTLRNVNPYFSEGRGLVFVSSNYNFKK